MEIGVSQYTGEFFVLAKAFGESSKYRQCRVEPAVAVFDAQQHLHGLLCVGPAERAGERLQHQRQGFLASLIVLLLQKMKDYCEKALTETHVTVGLEMLVQQSQLSNEEPEQLGVDFIKCPLLQIVHVAVEVGLRQEAERRV